MPDYSQIAAKMHFGRGKEAQVLGPPWSVYRVGSSATGNILDDANLILQNVPAVYKTNTTNIRHSMEAEKIPGLILYEVSCDITELQLLVGDIFVLADTIYQTGHNKVTFSTQDINVFCLIQDTPAKLTIGARLNKLATVQRQSVSIGSNNAWPSGSDAAQPLLLDSGKFCLGEVSQDAGTIIPIGLFPVPRPYGDKSFDQAPGMLRKSGWACYMPPLNNFLIAEGDRITTVDGAQYRVVFPAFMGTGTVGSYLFLERESPENPT